VTNRFRGVFSEAQKLRETADAAPALPAEIVPGTDAELSTSEQQALSHYEQVIERGLKTFFEVGAALLRVRDLRLYRTEYRTFEEYCADRWGLARNRAYQLIDAAGVVQNVQNFGHEAPTIESHAAALATLKDPEQQRQAWQQAVQRAQELGKKLTAALVDAVVKEMQPAAPAPPPREPPQTAAWDEDAHESDPHIGSESEGPYNAAQHASEGAVIVEGELVGEDDDDEADGDVAELPGSITWPDGYEELLDRLEENGYELSAESEARITYEHPVSGDVVRVVKPPALGQVRIRVVANADEDWADVAERLALVGVKLDRPRPGVLPEYPETQRAYGVLDLDAEQLDVVSHLQTELTMTRDERDRLAELPDDLLTIIEEYQHHITRAQNYKPTSERGEAVSPLLRLIERLYLQLIESEPDG
jgi:hypothetical protein